MFDGCIIKWNIINQFWTYIFLIQPKSIQMRFFIFLENNIMQTTLSDIHYLSNIWVKKVPHKGELNDFYLFQKSLYSMLLFQRYIKICNSTPNPGQSRTIYAPHFSSLQPVPTKHCLYANAVVQSSVQHCPCYMVWKTKVHTWCRHCHFCINAPMGREKRWVKGLFDPPSYKKIHEN